MAGRICYANDMRMALSRGRKAPSEKRLFRKGKPSPEAGGDKEALSRRKRQGHAFQAENKHSIYKKES